MAISIQSRRSEHSITVWLTGLHETYKYDDRVLEFFIREEGTSQYESDDVLYEIPGMIGETGEHKFDSLNSSTRYEIKVVISWIGGRCQDQTYTKTISTTDPNPIIEYFDCFGEVPLEDGKLRAWCRFGATNISEGKTEYAIYARQTGTEYWWIKEGDNLYKSSIKEEGDSVKGSFTVALYNEKDVPSKSYDFRLVITAGSRVKEEIVTGVVVYFQPIEKITVEQNPNMSSDGEYVVNIDAYLKQDCVASFNCTVINVDTDTWYVQNILYQGELRNANEPLIMFSEYLPPGEYYVTVNIRVYETEEDYIEDEHSWIYIADKSMEFTVEEYELPVNYWQWTTKISKSSIIPYSNKVFYPVTATEWKNFISRIQELKAYMYDMDLSQEAKSKLEDIPTVFNTVNENSDFTVELYNEVARALQCLSYSTYWKYDIGEIDENTYLSANIFTNLRDQFNFIIDNIMGGA